MTRMLNLTEASVLAMHTMALLALRPGQRLSTIEITEIFGCSSNTLSKVMQRLARSGLVRSQRGPTGGFVLIDEPEEITILDIYEAIDGPIEEQGRLLASCRCKEVRCLLGRMVDEIGHDVRERLAGANLAELAETMNLEEEG